MTLKEEAISQQATAKQEQRTARVNGDFHGLHASGDINNHAPVTFNMGEQTPESRRQAEFARDTKIHCNRPTRETLEWLMTHCGFTHRELRSAWKSDTIFWSEPEQQLKAKLNWFTYIVLGWGMFWLSAAVIMISSIGMSLGHVSNLKTLLVFWAGLPVFIYSLWLSVSAFIHPFRTAQRVKRALDNCDRNIPAT